MGKFAKTIYDINNLSVIRWSPCAFDTKPVEKDKIRSILEAASGFQSAKKSSNGTVAASGWNPSWMREALFVSHFHLIECYSVSVLLLALRL